MTGEAPEKADLARKAVYDALKEMRIRKATDQSDLFLDCCIYGDDLDDLSRLIERQIAIPKNAFDSSRLPPNEGDVIFAPMLGARLRRLFHKETYTVGEIISVLSKA